MKTPHAGRRRKGAAVIVCVAVAASLDCRTPTDPQDVLATDLTGMPGSITAGDSLSVTLTIVNPTSRPIQLISGDSCVVLPNVFSAGGDRLFWGGTGLGCLTVVSKFTVPARGTLTRQFPLVAFLQEPTAPWDYVVPPPPGTYYLVMDMHVKLANIERQFVVDE